MCAYGNRGDAVRRRDARMRGAVAIPDVRDPGESSWGGDGSAYRRIASCARAGARAGRCGAGGQAARRL